jgi:hypothetical protein
MSRYDLRDTYIEIYYKSNPEFEKVRELCLEEDNWLRHNYTRENLILEEHTGYGVVYQESSGKPMVMGGVFRDNRYPRNVAKMINRLYTFPDFRMTHSDMTDGFRVTCSLIDELASINTYELYLITMQNRRGGKSKRWWDTWVKHMDIASSGKWKLGTGYLQTCPANVQKCWQNYVYMEIVSGSLSEWSPKNMSHEEWLALEEGI